VSLNQSVILRVSQSVCLSVSQSTGSVLTPVYGVQDESIGRRDVHHWGKKGEEEEK
jgi:hypothetical protein